MKKESRDKPVMSVDDLYQILYTYWALDTATYADERQRVQVATGILIATFTGCRPVLLFDTGRAKYEIPDTLIADGPPSYNGSAEDYDSDSNSKTDPDLDQGSENFRSIRYRDINLFLLRARVPGGPNIPVAKVILVYTKGEQRREQSSA